ncbi:MAG: bifunctional tetrahydrofolate synthase/dihydrofolate synthase [Moraxellaceae bacterium]|nr:MAG: bifunctional tetrahydrofolate synthase/dihydrofolate synthase [Moraxellaceae bacterium]
MNGRRNLAGWLQWLEDFHPIKIDLGLDRVSEVARHLNVLEWQCPVVTVAGTNGKGSCVAAIEAIYSAHGYRVGTYTSPHLISFNERIRVKQENSTDAAIIAAFERVEQARDDISLSYFEFTTLAALLVFKQSSLDLVVLEVGLGGRLDAVNVVDCSVAVITSIALDHTAWLGNDEASIAKEKAGVIRPGKPLVLAMQNLPTVIRDIANSQHCPIYEFGSEFSFSNELSYPLAGGAELGACSWHGQTASVPSESLSIDFPKSPGIQLESLAAALQAVYLLELPLDTNKVRHGIDSLILPGRFQVIELEKASVILDVAHNPAAGENLANKLRYFNTDNRTVQCVFGVLADKDVSGLAATISSQIDCWFPCALTADRAAEPDVLVEILKQLGSHVDQSYLNTQQAFEAAMQRGNNSQNRDIILIIGSFYTVGDWLVNHHASGEQASE